MTRCGDCAKAGYRGYRRDGMPSCVYFWCPVVKHHDPHGIVCNRFVEGRGGLFYEDGERFGTALAPERA